MNAESSYQYLIHQCSVSTSHILQVDSLLAVEWINVRDKLLLLYIMIQYSGNIWYVLTVKEKSVTEP